MTSEAAKSEWGTPDLVISNPPFDPTLPGASFPLHSDAGPLGDKILSSLLDNLSRWNHRPRAIQLVLYSLASSGCQEQVQAERHGFNPRDLFLLPILENFAEQVSARMQAHEIAAPMSITDFLEQHHGASNSRQRKAWLNDVREKLACQDQISSIDVHLFVADLFLDVGQTPSDRTTSWASWKTERMGEEGFVLPISADRHLTDSEIFYRYFQSVLSTRLEKQPVSWLDLNDPYVQKIISDVLRDILVPTDDFCVVALDRERVQQNVTQALWFHGNVLKEASVVIMARDKLSSLLSKKWNLLGATICDFYPDSPFVKTHIKADTASEVVDACFSSDIGAQRFVVISNWPDGCATQARQAVLANLFLNILVSSQRLR